MLWKIFGCRMEQVTRGWQNESQALGWLHQRGWNEYSLYYTLARRAMGMEFWFENLKNLAYMSVKDFEINTVVPCGWDSLVSRIRIKGGLLCYSLQGEGLSGLAELAAFTKTVFSVVNLSFQAHAGFSPWWNGAVISFQTHQHNHLPICSHTTHVWTVPAFWRDCTNSLCPLSTTETSWFRLVSVESRLHFIQVSLCMINKTAISLHLSKYISSNNCFVHEVSINC